LFWRTKKGPLFSGPFGRLLILADLFAEELRPLIRTAPFIVAAERRWCRCTFSLARRRWVRTRVFWKAHIATGQILARRIGTADHLWCLFNGHTNPLWIADAIGGRLQSGDHITWHISDGLDFTGLSARPAVTRFRRKGRLFVAHQCHWVFHIYAFTVGITEFGVAGFLRKCPVRRLTVFDRTS